MRYRSGDEDSACWDGFDHRDGDLVVSTRSKHGTTWMQTILLLLIHGAPPWPASLGDLSPWLDHLVEPRDTVMARLAAQPYRRVIKTHTPLDGLPLDPRATYIVVARHPLDAAISLYHQGDNIDRDRLRDLTGTPAPASATPRPPLRDWLLAWIDRSADPVDELDSLDGVMHHLSDAWARRHNANVVLVHFDDLRTDLLGQMRRLGHRLDLAQPEQVTEQLAAEASFSAMRGRAAQLVPNTQGILRDPSAFFREGRSGTGMTVLTRTELDRYHQRVAGLAPPALVAWLHRST